MNDRAVDEFRRAGETQPAVRALWIDQWYGRVAMLLCTIVLLTFSYAPYHQFYLAWVGLVPFLLMIRRTRSAWTAFWWGWGGGTAYFIANMWWLAYVTVPGMFALLGYLGLSWGAAAAIIRGSGLMGNGKNLQFAICNLQFLSRIPFSIFAIAIVWSGCEWFRGNYPFDGLPWLYVGHSQTPVLVMCQIADVFGATGVTFWVVLVNALAVMLVISGRQIRSNGPVIGMVAVLLLAVFGYGVFRMKQPTLSPGPTVMVVQADFPQSNETGKKGASVEEIVRFHLEETGKGLEKLQDIADVLPPLPPGEGGGEGELGKVPLSTPPHPDPLPGGEGKKPDLVVWSETMMPDINARARQILQGIPGAGVDDYGALAQETHQAIQDLALKYKVGLVAGGSYFDAWIDRQTKKEMRDNRNSAYYFDRTGLPLGRYDKIHLVPWGEFIPFRHSIPWLYRIFLELSPYDYDYTLTPGKIDELKVFELSDPGSAVGWRFVVPICFEDIDAGLVAKMLRPLPGGNQQKRADFLVNITNDGWFKANQQPQHFQVAVFRCIENRVPMARSVNTGISGFIDPLGRVDASKLIAQYDEGTSVATMMLDSRTSLFTRYGEWFGRLCAIIAGVVAMWGVVGWIRRRGTTLNSGSV